MVIMDIMTTITCMVIIRRIFFCKGEIPFFEKMVFLLRLKTGEKILFKKLYFEKNSPN